jgi:hypothetical protein
MMVTQDAKIFRQVQTSRRIIAICLVFSYCSWKLVLQFLDLSYRGASTPFLYPREWGYKEGNRVGYNMIPIRILSLFTYFTYIFIDIIIYALENMLWSSEIFWMVGRVITDSFLGLPSLCGVVPRVPILISSPRVLDKWVDAGWFGSSLSMMNL